MKKLLILLVAMHFIAGVAYGASVVGSDHDMRSYIADETTTQVCVFCHTPHQASGAAVQDPLWNKTVTATDPFGVYASDTLQAVPTDIGGQAVGSQSISALCMGCHDGTVAVNSLYKAPTDGTAGTATLIPNTSSAYLGTSLTDDHPINFVYDAALVTADAADGGSLNDPTAITGVKLFATMVQCASCHNVHDPAITPFLRMSNDASALCTECHNK